MRGGRKALLGGRCAAVAGAEVVDVAHASLLQGHRRPSRRHAHDPRPRAAAALCALELVRVASLRVFDERTPRARASSCRVDRGSVRVPDESRAMNSCSLAATASASRSGGEEGLNGVLWRRDDHCDFTCRSIAAVWMDGPWRRAGGSI
jgi:hypothetical protein